MPQDLRTADPSFWHEMEHGQFGLAGSIAFLRGRSPFEVEPPSAAWARELHGFGWLRNLDAAGSDEARETDASWRSNGRCGSAPSAGSPPSPRSPRAA